MSAIFTKEGFKSLRFAYGVALAGLGVVAFLAGGSYLYWQLEKKNDQQSQRQLQELRTRLDVVRRERNDLRDSGDTFKLLLARGTFSPEQRMDLIEALAALKQRHKLAHMEYEILPQRTLRLAGGTTLPGVEMLGSRIKLKARAYHDGDLVAFLDEFPRLNRGFFPIARCVIRRPMQAEQNTSAVRTGAALVDADDGDEMNKSVRAQAVTAAAGLEVECTIDWVTLVDKSLPNNLQAMSRPQGPL